MADAAEQFRRKRGIALGHVDGVAETVEVAPTGQAEVVETSENEEE